MENKLHGHDVMQMMIDMNQSFTKESLREAIQARFGEDVRFETCSAGDMTSDQLIDFLMEKEKLISEGDQLKVNAERLCQH